MEKVRPWCGQAMDRGWLKTRTEQNSAELIFNHYCQGNLKYQSD